MRDFSLALQGWPFWNTDCEAHWQDTKFPHARILQNRADILQFCIWIQAQQIRSYLEIGIWSGHLVTLLQHLFQFEKVAICDIRDAEKFGVEITVPPETHCFWGDSCSPEYIAWRQQLGPIDLVLIDGAHSLEALIADFEINRHGPGRFLAFHDVCNPRTPEVQVFWQKLPGPKWTICQPFMEPELRAMAPMGIGIWQIPH